MRRAGVFRPTRRTHKNPTPYWAPHNVPLWISPPTAIIVVCEDKKKTCGTKT